MFITFFGRKCLTIYSKKENWTIFKKLKTRPVYATLKFLSVWKKTLNRTKTLPSTLWFLCWIIKQICDIVTLDDTGFRPHELCNAKWGVDLVWKIAQHSFVSVRKNDESNLFLDPRCYCCKKIEARPLIELLYQRILYWLKK